MDTHRMIASIVMALGVFACLIGGYQIYRAVRSASWPGVPGTMTRSEVTPYAGSSRNYYQVSVEYQYVVDGVRHTSRRFTFTETYSRDTAALWRSLAGYGVGAAVTVYVDPEDPGTAVLKPGLNHGINDYAALIAGMALLGFAGLARSLMGKKPEHAFR